MKACSRTIRNQNPKEYRCCGLLPNNVKPQRGSCSGNAFREIGTILVPTRTTPRPSARGTLALRTACRLLPSGTIPRSGTRMYSASRSVLLLNPPRLGRKHWNPASTWRKAGFGPESASNLAALLRPPDVFPDTFPENFYLELLVGPPNSSAECIPKTS